VNDKVRALENESAELRALTTRLRSDLHASRERERKSKAVKLDVKARDALKRPYRGQ
jgi:hypothetical protein